MKGYLVSCTSTLLGAVGFLVMAGGALFGTWRIVAVGSILVGVCTLLWRKSDPDYLPEWCKKSLLPFSLLWIVAGGIVFLFSWL